LALAAEICALTSAGDRPGTRAGDVMDLQEQLLAIEHRLWTNDAAFYEANLATEALLVFAETGVITRDVAVVEIRRENAEGRRWEHVDFTDIRYLRIAADVTLLTYQVSARWALEASSTSLLASSVYVQRVGEWKLIFHQQTSNRSESRTV
jgi:hypothetical protein